MSDTAAAVGAASGVRVWGGEVGEAASLILLELEVGSLLRLATHPDRLRLALQARGCATHLGRAAEPLGAQGANSAGFVTQVMVIVLGRMAVKLIAATWLAYVGFWREAAAAIGRDLLAAATAVVAPLHLGGAVTAAPGVVAVATGGASGSTAHGAAGSALALAAAVARVVARLWVSVAAGVAAAAAAAAAATVAAAAAAAGRGGASGPALREAARLLAVAFSAAAVMAAVAVAGVSCKRAGERAIAGARALMDGHFYCRRRTLIHA